MFAGGRRDDRLVGNPGRPLALVGPRDGPSLRDPRRSLGHGGVRRAGQWRLRRLAQREPTIRRAARPATRPHQHRRGRALPQPGGDPAYRQTVDSVLAKFPAGKAAAVNTYWTTHSPTLVSADKHATFAAVSLKDPDDNIDMVKYDPMRDAVAGSGYSVQVGGANAGGADINERVSASIGRAEGLSLPIL